MSRCCSSGCSCAASLDPILTSPTANWHDLRLASAAALTRGYDLYYLPGDGPDAEASGFAFARARPGQAYLSYNPLVTLLAQDRAYQMLLPTISQRYFERLRGEAGLRGTGADDVAFRAHVPKNVRYVLFRVDGGSHMTGRAIHGGSEAYLGRYLPRFQRAIDIAPGWRAFVPDGELADSHSGR